MMRTQLDADDIVLFGESEEELRLKLGQSAEVCRREDLKSMQG